MDLRLEDIVAGQDLVTIPFDSTVDKALELLWKYNILSLPVVSKDLKQVQGFIDVLDIMNYLVKVSSKPLTDLAQGESRSITTDDFQMLSKRTKDFSVQKVSEVINFSRKDPFQVMQSEQLIRETLEPMSEGIHRIAVFDKSGTMRGVVTQYDIIQCLLKEPKPLDFSKTLSQFPGYSKNIISVTEDTLAIEAFFRMYQTKVSALGIIDASGTLTGTVSATDVKQVLRYDDLRGLLHSVQDFIKDLRVLQGRAPEYLVCTTLDATLYDVLNFMYQEKVHRLFIVDHLRKPKGVVSLTDIIKESTTCLRA